MRQRRQSYLLAPASERFLRPASALAQTTGFSAEERAYLMSLLRRAVYDGADFDVAVLGRLGARDFDWPEFDRWQALFAERGQFPPLWHRLVTRPTSRSALEVCRAYREHKLYLLVDWLQGLETAYDQTRTALARYAKLGLGARIARQGEGTPCPVCDPLDPRDVYGGRAEFPPFHPGCRCLLLPILRRARASQTAHDGSSGRDDKSRANEAGQASRTANGRS